MWQSPHLSPSSCVCRSTSSFTGVDFSVRVPCTDPSPARILSGNTMVSLKFNASGFIPQTVYWGSLLRKKTLNLVSGCCPPVVLLSSSCPAVVLCCPLASAGRARKPCVLLLFPNQVTVGVLPELGHAVGFLFRCVRGLSTKGILHVYIYIHIQ